MDFESDYEIEMNFSQKLEIEKDFEFSLNFSFLELRFFVFGLEKWALKFFGLEKWALKLRFFVLSTRILKKWALTLRFFVLRNKYLI